jgi:hypothetical protein
MTYFLPLSIQVMYDLWFYKVHKYHLGQSWITLKTEVNHCLENVLITR